MNMWATAFGVLASLCAQIAAADEAETKLEEVLVTATRQPRRIADEPTRVEVLDHGELEEKIAASPGDVSKVLSETPGLRIQQTSPGLGAVNIRIEGLHGRYSRIALESFYVGHQSLTGAGTDNPYRTTSPSYVMFGLSIQRELGPVTAFLNFENFTDRRLTRFQPLLLPQQASDGRWTVYAWGPLDRRVINLGVRWRTSEQD